MPVTPDLSLIRDYTPKDDAWRPNAVTHFSNGAQHLYFINTSHVSGIENPTCETIRMALDAYHPKCLIIEGVPSIEGTSPPRMAAAARKASTGNFKEGEVLYTAHEALTRELPFRGAEPPDSQVFEEMNKLSYSNKDVMGFYLYRFIPLDRKQGLRMDEASFAERANYYLANAHFFDGIHNEDRLTYPEFKAWYDAHNTEGKPLMDTVTNDYAPYVKPDATYFQRMSADIGGIRERNIVPTIAQAINDYGSVLVVYGGAHLSISRDVYEKMLGPGETTVLVPNQLQPDKARDVANTLVERTQQIEAQYGTPNASEPSPHKPAATPLSLKPTSSLPVRKQL